MSEHKIIRNYIHLLLVCLLFVGGLTDVSAIDNTTSKPNVIMITCHDLGQHLGCYGIETVTTPNLDKLAEKGIRFSNFYSTSSVCSPGRASLHTGRYPQSNGLVGLTHAPFWWKLKDDEKHTAALLKNAGYRSYLAGFNHIGNAERLGYDNVLSPSKAEKTVAATIDLIENSSKQEKPFFVKVGFTEVHRGFKHGADSIKGIFVPAWLQNTSGMRLDLAQFQATIRFFDERVGEILTALENSEIAPNTLVIMTSDHGIPYPGSKWSGRKAGFEVPFILYQEGTVFTGGKAYSQVMSNVDVLPTLLEYLKIEIPENIEGESFLNFIQNENVEAPRKYAFSQYTPDIKRDNLCRSVITEEYHLIRNFDQGRAVAYPVKTNPVQFAAHVERSKTKGTRPFVQLYNLEDDPFELNNIAAFPENVEVVKELSGALLDWMEDVNDPLLEGPLKTPYYEKAIDDLIKSNLN